MEGQEVMERNINERATADGSKNTKRMIIAALTTVVVTAAIFIAVFMLLNGRAGGQMKPLLFIKNDSLRVMLKDMEEPASLSGEFDLKNSVHCYSKDNTRLLYTTKDNGADVLWLCALTEKQLLSDGSSKIDGDVIKESCRFSADAAKVYFLNADGSLYQYIIKTAEKEKLFSDLKSYKWNRDGSAMIIEDTDNTIYYVDGQTLEKTKIGSGNAVFIDDNAATVLFTRGGAVYRWVSGGEAEKAVDSYKKIHMITEDGRLYYSTEEKESMALKELVNDDMLDADKKTAAGSGGKIDMTNIVGTVWYGAAYSTDMSDYWAQTLEIKSVNDGKVSFSIRYEDGDKWNYSGKIRSDMTIVYYDDQGKYGAVTETLTLSQNGKTPTYYSNVTLTRAADEGYGAELFTLFNKTYTLKKVSKRPYEIRNQLRRQLVNQKFTYTNTTLWYYDGSGNTKVADNVAKISTAFGFKKTPVLLFGCFGDSDSWAVKMSSLDADATVSDVKKSIAKKQSEGYTRYYAGTGEIFDCQMNDGAVQSDFTLSKDEEMLWYIQYPDSKEDTKKKGGELYSVTCIVGCLGEPQREADDVMAIRVSDTGEAYYFCAVNKGVGDLYYGGKEIAMDVSVRSLTFLPDTGEACFLYDVGKNGSGTLGVYDGSAKKKIAADVFDYRAFSADRMALLCDYTSKGCGELKLYNGSSELEALQSDVEALI